MSSDSPSRVRPAPATTPCVGVCRMDRHGLCLGCRRTLAEIAAWGTLDEAARRRWMREVRPLRSPPTP